MSGTVKGAANDAGAASLDVNALVADVLRDCNVRLNVRDPVFIAVVLNQHILERSLQRLAIISAKTAAETAHREVALQLNQLDSNIVARFNEASSMLDENVTAAIQEGIASLRAGVSEAGNESLGRFASAFNGFETMLKRVQWALIAVLGVAAVGGILGLGIVIGRLV